MIHGQRRVGYTWALALAVAGWAGWGMEGKLPNSIIEKTVEDQCNFGFAGVKAFDLVKTLNEKRFFKIGIHPKFGAKSFDKIEFSGKTILQSVDFLAEKVGGKAFVIRDFVYIADALPAGVKTANGEGEKAEVGGSGALGALEVSFNGVLPGQYRKLPWLSVSKQICQEKAQPILIFAHDDSLKDKAVEALYFETVILDDPEVREALKDFTCILLDSTNKDWPTPYMEQAKGGFAVYLATADGMPAFTFCKKAKSHRVSISQFVSSVKATRQRNESVVKRLQASPKKKEPGEPEPEAKDLAAQKGGEGKGKKPETILDKLKREKEEEERRKAEAQGQGAKDGPKPGGKKDVEEE